MPTFREDLHLGHEVALWETDDIRDRAITSQKIALKAIITELIADLAVTTEKLANLSVTTPKIAELAVVTSKLAELAVTTEKVAEQAITTEKIHDLAVVTEKIAELAVTTGKIADLAVTTEKLADGAVTNEKIHDLTISWLKLDADLQNIIASREEGGVALSNEWGNSTLIGLTQKMLSEALGNVHKDGNNFISLQQQIDEIVSGGATVNLVANPSVIFANTATDITLTASANKNASNISITGGELSEPITGSGTLVSGTDHNVNLPIGTLTYLATFIISGLDRTVSRTVSIANKIYYGAGQSDAVLNTEAMVFHTPAVAQPSFTQVITTALNDYIYFEVPSEMNNITKLELYDDPSFPTELAIESVATSRAGYKAYKTVNSRLAGTHTYKIS